MDKHPECVIECQTATYKCYPPCQGECDMRLAIERRTRPTKQLGMSLADQIPRWYEGGTCQQMLDEAFAQIRLLERPSAPAAPNATPRTQDDSFTLVHAKDECHALRNIGHVATAELFEKAIAIYERELAAVVAPARVGMADEVTQDMAQAGADAIGTFIDGDATARAIRVYKAMHRAHIAQGKGE